MDYSIDEVSRVYRGEVRARINENFDFEAFFSHIDLSETDEKQSYGASVIITPNQVITIPNNDNYKAFHQDTQFTIVAEIYNLSEELTFSDECSRLNKKNIRMHLRNENGLKMICIFFPDKITKGHIDLLQAYENTYGEIVEGISKRYNLPIVVIEDANGEDNYSYSFAEAIKYAQTLPRIRNQDTPNEFILGQVISPDGLTLCNRKYVEIFSVN